jgi:hypothetical protein
MEYLDLERQTSKIFHFDWKTQFSGDYKLNIPSICIPPREECTLSTDDIMLLNNSSEPLKTILTLRGYINNDVKKDITML